MESEEKLKIILQSRIRNSVIAFLKPREVFFLSMLNKSMFQWFSFNGIQYLHAIKYSEKAWNTKIKELKYQMNYFRIVFPKKNQRSF